MAKIYFRKIQESGGAFTLDQVPTRWRDAVEALLEAANKVVEFPAVDVGEEGQE